MPVLRLISTECLKIERAVFEHHVRTPMSFIGINLIMCEQDTESFYLNATNPNFVFPANKKSLFVPKSNFISCNSNGFFGREEDVFSFCLMTIVTGPFSHQPSDPF